MIGPWDQELITITDVDDGLAAELSERISLLRGCGIRRVSGGLPTEYPLGCEEESVGNWPGAPGRGARNTRGLSQLWRREPQR